MNIADIIYGLCMETGQIVDQMENNRKEIHQLSTLCHLIDEFSIIEDAKTFEQLGTFVHCLQIAQVLMPLPSGRYGNALAVAIEMRMYQGALFMIQNASDLEIDLEKVSYDCHGKNAWNALHTFEISKLRFNTTKIAYDDEFYKDYPKLVEANHRNIDAAVEVEKILKEKNKEYKKM